MSQQSNFITDHIGVSKILHIEERNTTKITDLILMRNSRFAFWGLLLLFININVSGQKDYKKGYIIQNNNDTIYGLISLKSNYQNSIECEFKKNSDASPELFSPDDLRAYMIEDSKFYVSKNITLNDAKRKVFLEFLLHGIVDLFYYKVLDDEYFFIEKDSTIYQLSNEQKVALDKYDGKYLRSSNQYIGVLTYLFQQSPEILSKINSTRFEYKSLIKITKEYHDEVCKDYKCIDYTKSTKIKVWLEPNISLINSWMGLKSSGDLAKDIKPAIGINFRFRPFKIHYVWNFLVGVNYSTNYFYRDFYNNLWDGSYRTNRIEMKYPIIRFPLLFQYTFPTKKIQPFLSVGYNICYILKPEYSVRQVNRYAFADTVIIGGDMLTDFQKYQNGLLTGIGVRYKINEKSHIYLEADFEYRDPFAKFGNFLDYHYVKSLLFSFGYGFSLN